MRALVPPTLVALLFLATALAGCTTPERVHYWELTSRVEWTGENEGGVLLEQGPHCSWLRFDGETLTLTRAWGDPTPGRGILGRTWTGDVPDGGTTGGGYDWWFGAGTVRATVGGEDAVLNVSWDGDVPVLDGEAGFDGWTRTVEYDHEGLHVAETLTLRDHGSVPLKVHTQRELLCA